MLKQLNTPYGTIDVYYSWPDITKVRCYWPRKWWQLRRKPVTNARITLWIIEYLIITTLPTTRNQSP